MPFPSSKYIDLANPRDGLLLSFWASSFYFSDLSSLPKQGHDLSLTLCVLRLSRCLSLIISLTYLHIYFSNKVGAPWKQCLGVRTKKSTWFVCDGCHSWVKGKTTSINKIQDDLRCSFYYIHIAVSLGEIILHLYKKAIKYIICLERFLSKWFRFFKMF